MASYCIRCGQKIGLFKSLSLPEGPLCDECLQELGFTTDDKKRYDSMKGNYELLLAEARLRNPAILSFALLLRGFLSTSSALGVWGLPMAQRGVSLRP